MNTSIHILEFPSNLGLIEPLPGKEPGVRRLPEWLKDHGFYNLISPDQIYNLPPPPYSMHIDAESGIRNTDAIAAYALKQAVQLKQKIDSKIFTLVIGGDCSILIGNMIALKQTGTYSLFYLDGHTDFMWPELSQTHGAAGMDLALVSGNGPAKLTNILTLGPYIREENIWAVGNREYDKTYEETIIGSKINYFNLQRLEREGIDSCTSDFLSQVEKTESDGFWIHLDVDVLQDDIMPAVDSRQPGGLTYEQLNEILTKLLSDSLCAGLEITILDPDLDPDGRYTREFVMQVANCIRTSLNNRHS
jgi:arginase